MEPASERPRRIVSQEEWILIKKVGICNKPNFVLSD